MTCAEIAKKSGYRVGDIISLYGNAYQIDSIGETGTVLGHQTVENGHKVSSTSVYILDLTIQGWRLVSV